MYTHQKFDAPGNLTSLSYLEYLPENYGSGEKFPLVVFLHGAGERGDDLEKVAVHGWMKHVRQGEKLPFVMIAPQCPAAKYWGCYIESLNALLDMALEKYSVDPARVYLTGLSMGGTGTWMWSLANPERFAAVVPICGTGVYWYGGQLAKKSVWVFHGEADPVVPVVESINMVQSIRKHGGEPKLTLYPGVGHDSWSRAYADPALMEWMLAQTL